MNGPTMTITARLARLCNATTFRVFLLFIFILLFCWPYLSFVQVAPMERLFAYLFAVWALLVGVLIVVSAAGKESTDTNNNG